MKINELKTVKKSATWQSCGGYWRHWDDAVLYTIIELKAAITGKIRRNVWESLAIFRDMQVCSLRGSHLELVLERTFKMYANSLRWLKLCGKIVHVKLVYFTTLRKISLSYDSHLIWFCSLSDQVMVELKNAFSWFLLPIILYHVCMYMFIQHNYLLYAMWTLLIAKSRHMYYFIYYRILFLMNRPFVYIIIVHWN